MPTEICIPNPEYLIKSIAEQGYSLETSIADLIDNSITANSKKIEVLIDTERQPFTLFITDDGRGMSETELKTNMNFPSCSMEENRSATDLGRFGLGLKTASFAQTRRFTVISKKAREKKYNARTWDVNHLHMCGKWEVIINTEEEITQYLTSYKILTEGFLNPFSDYQPNTIVIWQGLYKFQDQFNGNSVNAILQNELSVTTKGYLQLIFHRFMEGNHPVNIRLNNEKLIPFNPFPFSLRRISVQRKLLMGSKLLLEGFVLPQRSIAESKEFSEWTLPNKSLIDMEGMYVYRADRIIVFGGWNNLIKKSSKLQLARLKVEIGNGIDHLFQLNVAKSSISIPFGERIAFVKYVSELKTEAEKEFYNYNTLLAPTRIETKNIFKKIPTSHGMALEIDKGFPLLKDLLSTLTANQTKQLKIIFRIITTAVNKIKKVYAEENYTDLIDKENIEESDVTDAINILLKNGISKQNILNDIIPSLGINSESLPAEILNLLK